MSDLKDRTRLFAVRIIRMVAAMPHGRTGDVVGRQVVKSGTSVGAHFREALRSRSKAEYVAKMNAGLMELEETQYWLEITRDAGLVSAQRLAPLDREAAELTAIFVSLINRWRRK